VRRGASWTAAYHRRLTVAAVARPVPSSVGASGVLAAARSWFVLAQTTSARRSVQPLSSGRAWSPWSTLPAGTPRRRSPVCPACGVHPSGVGVRDPAVRCPVTWGRRPEGPAVGRLLSTRPASSRLLSRRPLSSRLLSAPVRPDASVSFHLRRWRWGPGRGGRATVTTGTGGGPCGCRAVDGSSYGRGGGDAGDAAQVALVSGRSVADPGRRVGCGPRRPRLPAERPGRPGRRPEERPSWVAARWARERAAVPGGGTRGVAAVLGLGVRPRCVVVAEPDARLGGPGGATGGAGGDGRAAPARPKPAASAPGSLPAAL
jgi:hypothetical protein